MMQEARISTLYDQSISVFILLLLFGFCCFVVVINTLVRVRKA